MSRFTSVRPTFFHACGLAARGGSPRRSRWDAGVHHRLLRALTPAAIPVIAALAALATLARPATTQTLPPDADSASAFLMNVSDGFTVAAVGDIIIARPVSQITDPDFTRAMDIIARADVAFGNFETSAIDIRTFDGYPQAEYGGAWLIGVPAIARDLATLGFDMVARANNHTTDWGVEGMRATSRHLDEAGLIHAGAGETRAEARAGRYLDTPKGRVGVVSMASSFTPLSRAMDPMGEAPGRPGLSALRTTGHVLVTPEEIEVLRRIRDEQPEGSVRIPEDDPDDRLSLFGVSYRVGEGRGTEQVMNEVDLAEILQAIRKAKRNSDFVIATIHAHDPGNWSDEPPGFLVDLARATIDAGADQFIGHGPHQLRGIEIYKGKPIFYSLANFLFQVEEQEPVARDLYESFGLTPEEITDPEFNRRWLDLHFDDAVWYRSVIAESVFSGGQVSGIRLYPVELGYEMRGGNRGVPRAATPEAAREILESLAELSRPMGTVIEIEAGVGVVRVR